MNNILESCIFSFIPLFVAIDVIGNVPIFVSFVESVKGEKRRKIICDAVTTAI
jgi:small neutral amino acid transporter SnatA (MarC family)